MGSPIGHAPLCNRLTPSLTPSYPSPQHVCVQWAKFCFGKLLVQNEIYSNAKRIRNLPGMPNKLQYKFQISWDCSTLKGNWLAYCVAYYNIFLIKWNPLQNCLRQFHIELITRGAFILYDSAVEMKSRQKLNSQLAERGISLNIYIFLKIRMEWWHLEAWGRCHSWAINTAHTHKKPTPSACKMHGTVGSQRGRVPP